MVKMMSGQDAAAQIQRHTSDRDVTVSTFEVDVSLDGEIDLAIWAKEGPEMAYAHVLDLLRAEGALEPGFIQAGCIEVENYPGGARVTLVWVRYDENDGGEKPCMFPHYVRHVFV